jgi:hypothetical protein
MGRPLYDGLYVIVEGHTDQRLYNQYLDRRTVVTMLAHGKDEVLGALAILAAEGIPGVAGIIDADFARVGPRPAWPHNVLLTDTHDLETMIIKSPALDKLLEQCASPLKIAELADRVGVGPREILLRAGTTIGWLRYINEREGLNLKFDGIDFGKFTDRDTLRVDPEALVRTVRNHGRSWDVPEPYLIAAVAEVADSTADPWQVCCGHDLVEVLSVGLASALATRDAGERAPSRLEESLRLAYERQWFVQTSLWASLRKWLQPPAEAQP